MAVLELKAEEVRQKRSASLAPPGNRGAIRARRSRRAAAKRLDVGRATLDRLLNDE